ncbi:MAG: 7TM diverse intracellular signaling domain-containing protein [Bacteroidota bacterium]
MKNISIYITSARISVHLLHFSSIFLWLGMTHGFALSTHVPILKVGPQRIEYSLTPYLEILQTDKSIAPEHLSFNEISSKNFTGNFDALSLSKVDPQLPVQWLRFTLQNLDSTHAEFKLSVIFTDCVRFYFADANGQYQEKKAGDLEPFGMREVAVGQMCLIRFQVAYGATRTCYLRIESQTAISQQFKSPALQSAKLYTEPGFVQRFVTSRTYQALFYGAILIMLFYNLFVYCILRQNSYLYFSLFIFCLIVFLAADKGYLVELLMPNYPRLDLYIRFLSTPVVAFTYVLFSQKYLQSSRYSPRLDKVMQWILVFFVALFLFMAAGYWNMGRTIGVGAIILSLFFVLFLAIRSQQKGYTPARYFVAANIFFLVGGIIFASQRFFYTQNLFIQYSFQLAALMQVALFSMGLTDRISLMQNELSDKTTEAQRLEKEAALERERLIEEKNRELESKVRERTVEVLAQKEEIEAQNDRLALVNEELMTTQEVIALQNKKLELTVHERTGELVQSKEQLEQAILELDSFIYRTAHDIRGPLARLMGLSHIATLDVQDTVSLTYFEKLNSEAYNLDYILSRLSTVYEINHAEVKATTIDFAKLTADLRAKISFIEGFDRIAFQVEVEDNIVCHSDAALLLFIVRNLLENAIKFQNKKETQPYVFLRIGTQADKLVIQVMDNGIGISSEEAPRIFDMFSRTASKHKSAGMGLYMVRRGVEKLNGSITLADSATGLTNFQVEIPLHTVSQTVPTSES